MKKVNHKIRRYEQTDLNCGPNSLAQLLSFYEDRSTPEELIEKTSMIKGLGTFDAHLGTTAIDMSYRVTITVQNLYVFDPTWFKLPKIKLIANLKKSLGMTDDPTLRHCISGYIHFLEKDGAISFEPISKELIIAKLQFHPLIVGLCSTYLWREKRSTDTQARFRYGHFAVVNGYDPESDSFSIVDPFHTIPLSKSGRYKVKANELITAIHLAEATYDCCIFELSAR